MKDPVVNDPLPVGAVVDATPAPMPGAVTLKGRHGAVERLDAARHAPSLWTAMAGHDRIWTYIFADPPPDEAAFRGYIADCANNKERIFYAIVDNKGDALGIMALMEIRPAARVIEVGNILYTPALQRTRGQRQEAGSPSGSEPLLSADDQRIRQRRRPASSATTTR